ncbi:helix-turn-helix transcriptional regulator [Candidatus Bipolaricaulota bacterium]|nr:helix-turn-helix transcriptional regulator [Candidatus Bipolaricaulota bacterium]
MSEIKTKFGDRLRELREEKGLAQDKLAMKAGLNPSYVGFIERAQRNPTLETIHRLASALDVSTKELFDF